MGRHKALQVPRRLEPTHLLLSDPGRLVGILGPAVQLLVMPGGPDQTPALG